MTQPRLCCWGSVIAARSLPFLLADTTSYLKFLCACILCGNNSSKLNVRASYRFKGYMYARRDICAYIRLKHSFTSKPRATLSPRLWVTRQKYYRRRMLGNLHRNASGTWTKCSFLLRYLVWIRGTGINKEQTKISTWHSYRLVCFIPSRFEFNFIQHLMISTFFTNTKINYSDPG